MVRQAVDSFANSTVGDWDEKEDKKVEPTEDALWYAETIADKYYAGQVEEVLNSFVKLTNDRKSKCLSSI